MNPADIHRDGPTEDIEEHCIPMPEPGSTATDLLRQWQKAIDERESEEDDIPPGIEGCIESLNGYMYQVMWFLDKTLKLLAAQEATASTTPQPSAPAQTPTATEAPSPTGAAE